MKLMRTLLTTAVLGACAGLLPAQEAVKPYVCFPTCSEVDGRMLSLAGARLNTLGGDFINVQIVSGGPSFEIGLFDGDTGGGTAPHWDRVPPSEVGVTQLRFQLMADPNGDSSGTVEVGPPGGWLSNGANPITGPAFSSSVNGTPTGVMADNDWFDIAVMNVPAAAANPGSECPAGSYCYRLVVTLIPENPTGLFGPEGSTESNFKLRTTAEISLRPLAFSFVGALRSFNDAAILYPKFPDLSESTYDGRWRFVMKLDEPSSFFTVWDGDSDFGSFDCSDNDENDADTCNNSDPESSCVSNSNPDPAFSGQMVPAWADGTAARSEGVAAGDPASCNPSGYSTGSPNDDESPTVLGPPCAMNANGEMNCFFARHPSVHYTLETPINGGMVFTNPNPSGNQEWEQFRLETDTSQPADFYVAELPAGEYVLNFEGLDLANLNALRMSATVTGVPSASLGDRVWHDRNADGVQDPGEEGFSGVEVRLYRDSNADGLLDPSTDHLVATQTTSGDGDYDFLGLGAAKYFVDVVESTLPANTYLTTANEPYSMPSGPYALAESEDHDEADFGYVSGALGDLVWSDNNADGIFQPEQGEVGIGGVVVQLQGDVNGDGNILTLTATTDDDGYYLFEGLSVPADYDVRVVASNFNNGAPLNGASQTYDLDGNLDDRTWAAVDLLQGAFQNLDADFGYVRPCAPCEGKISQMKMLYLGSVPAYIEVAQKKGGDIVYSGVVEPFGYFTAIGQDKKGTLSTEVKIYVDGALNAAFHTSCSVPIGPGLVDGDIMIVEAYSRGGGLTCPLDGGSNPPSDPACNECSGKVTQLSLMYTGAAPALVEVVQKKPADTVFSGLVAPGEVFTVSGTDKKGTLGTEIRLYVDGSLHTSIHTSCSVDIGPGYESGDFVVVEGYSKGGGLLCSLP